jgi:hypothetical protein
MYILTEGVVILRVSQMTLNFRRFLRVGFYTFKLRTNKNYGKRLDVYEIFSVEFSSRIHEREGDAAVDPTLQKNMTVSCDGGHESLWLCKDASNFKKIVND